MSWQHIRPDTLPWEVSDEGVAIKRLASHPFPVHCLKLNPGQTTGFSGMALCCSGAGAFSDGTPFNRGDLIWRVEVMQISAGPMGCSWYQLELPHALKPPESALTVAADACPWQNFDDPAGRPTQPVQVLLEGKLAALRTRFVPTYIATEHWHDFDTLYFIMSGDMQFGFEGQYYTGDIRQVTGGFSYGPEKPGPEGVEFVLFSCGGPVNLHWDDLEQAPRGALQP